MKIVIVLLFLAVVAAAYKYEPLNGKKPNGNIGNRLFLGETAAIGQFPYTVGLKRGSPPSSTPKCGGSIISSKHIITEAWCFGQHPDMTIIAGCVDFNSEDCEVYQFENVWQHPNESGMLRNDISIISIQGEFALSDSVQIIPLAQETVPDNSSAIITGWSPELLWLDVTVEPCVGDVDPTVICTVPGAVGDGDYGCPLVVDGTLAGIAVYGFSKDIHQRIGPYVEWINSVINP